MDKLEQELEQAAADAEQAERNSPAPLAIRDNPILRVQQEGSIEGRRLA